MTMHATITPYNEIAISALHEVGNIGAGHAMTALAALVGQRVVMDVPEVGIVPLRQFPQMLGGVEETSVGVYMPVTGEAPGHVAFLWSHGNACRLADHLLDRSLGGTTILEEMECSALMEVGNILTSSYLTAISEMTGLTLLTAPPVIAVDMTAAILSAIATEFVSLENEALTITTHIGKSFGKIDGFFIYIPEPDSLSVLLRALQVDG
jgi:chemotaxis protein CheC